MSILESPWLVLARSKTGITESRVRRLRTQIAEQVGEGGIEGVVVFPVRAVGDVVFAKFDG